MDIEVSLGENPEKPKKSIAQNMRKLGVHFEGHFDKFPAYSISKDAQWNSLVSPPNLPVGIVSHERETSNFPFFTEIQNPKHMNQYTKCPQISKCPQKEMAVFGERTQILPNELLTIFASGAKHFALRHTGHQKGSR